MQDSQLWAAAKSGKIDRLIELLKREDVVEIINQVDQVKIVPTQLLAKSIVAYYFAHVCCPKIAFKDGAHGGS